MCGGGGGGGERERERESGGRERERDRERERESERETERDYSTVTYSEQIIWYLVSLQVAHSLCDSLLHLDHVQPQAIILLMKKK